MASIHAGDIGTRLAVTVLDADGDPVDISTATTKQIWLRPPIGSTRKVAATFVNDGSDGQLYYTTTADDLSVAGEWSLQAYVVLPSGTWHTDILRFDVSANL